jgi:hypothetical protein
LTGLATATAARPLADAARVMTDPLPPRPAPAHGDLRRSARRCAACEGHVPVGMSICPVCGFDQETERRIAGRIGVVERARPGPAPAPPGIRLIGGLAVLTGLALATITVLRFDLVGPALAPFLAALAWLGLYGGIQLLRGFRVRPLAMGLALAATLTVALAFLAPVLDSRRSGGGVDEPAALRMGLGAASLAALTAAAVYLGGTRSRRFFAERRPLYAEPGDEDEWLGGYTTTI